MDVSRKTNSLYIYLNIYMYTFPTSPLITGTVVLFSFFIFTMSLLCIKLANLSSFTNLQRKLPDCLTKKRADLLFNYTKLSRLIFFPLSPSAFPPSS